MSKRKIIYFIFQTIVALTSLAAIVFIIIDFIHTLPLCRAYQYSIDDVQPILYQTSVGKIVLYMQTTNTENFLILAKEAVLTFLRYLHPICIVFLVFIIFILGVYSFSDNQENKDLFSYCSFLIQIALVYLAKYLLSAAIFGIFYASNMASIGTGLTIMSYFILFANLVLIFYCTLFFLKWCFSFKPFIRQIRENHQKIA